MKKVIMISAGLLVAHVILREQRKKDPVVHLVESIPLNYSAMTIPAVGIFISKKEANNSAILNHEKIHWQQYQKMGLLPFIGNYLKGLIVHGYDHHPMELEARYIETSDCRMNYTECVRNGTARTVFNPNFRKPFNT